MLFGTVVPNNQVPNAADVRYWDNFAVHNRFYGAQVGPLSREGATQLCESLKSAGGSCIIQRN